MVDPPPLLDKQAIRGELRERRRENVAALPDAVRALVFSRPPAPVAGFVPAGANVGLYHATGAEAPTLGYAKWFHENGHALALPRFGDRDADMQFALWRNPYDDEELEIGPFGLLQPAEASEPASPDVLFVPLVGFTAAGDRLGQGGGHYDRWLEAHPDVPAIGLAWDCQEVEFLPHEPHDRRLAMIVTPTRVIEVQP